MFDWIRSQLIFCLRLWNNQEIVDHETWIYDLEEANQNGYPTWFKSYSMKQQYDMVDLSPKSHAQLAETFKTNDSAFDAYLRWTSTVVGSFPLFNLFERFFTFFLGTIGRCPREHQYATGRAELSTFAEPLLPTQATRHIVERDMSVAESI